MTSLNDFTDEASRAWLKQKGVPELLDGLVAQLVLDRPDDIVEYLIVELSKLSKYTPAAQLCAAKMRAAGAHELHIRAFLQSHAAVSAGSTGTIAEADIVPATGLPLMASLSITPRTDLIGQTVVLKLNGGLGTGMGLSSAKSLLSIKDGRTFLDYIALQVIHMRKITASDVRFMLMDSFSTSEDTRKYLASRYSEFAKERFSAEVEVMQGKTPKISQATLKPVEYPADREHEWVPPGHGELYCALESSGKLNQLLAQGFRYMFVSNCDNLGATLDVGLLSFLAERKLDFLMEVCERQESDKKGGHLACAAASGALLLREAAQCAKSDEPAFQDISKHRYFNTNNLWINLESLRRALDKYQGILPLPTIRNAKTVNPTDPNSEKVYQLETAMGTAITCFEHAGAVVVPRSRFAPVKTCSDLLALRSDCYEETEDHRLVLIAERNGVPPVVTLEDKHYKFIDQFERLVAHGVPSLRKCLKLSIEGPVYFAPGVIIEGTVKIVNASGETKEVTAGVYSTDIRL